MQPFARRVGRRPVTFSSRREHASIRDVARKAGVSTATVSRALRGLPSVTPQTRARVEQAADALAYAPSPVASGLASGRTQTVGVVAPLSARWFLGEVFAGAEPVLRSAGYDLLLYNVGDADGRSRFFRRLPLARRVDAVLVLGLPMDDRERAQLESLGVPLAVVGGQWTDAATVRIDEAAGGAMAARYLLHLGHTDLAVLTGTACGQRALAADARRDGFLQALREAGVALPDCHVVAEQWGFEGGAAAMSRLLTEQVLPTAVFAECDEMALGALRTLRRAGINVPGRISVMGFDDHEMASLVDLTTIAQPVAAQGEAAATWLLDMLTGATDPDDVAGSSAPDMVFPTRLVVRASTGPPRP